MNNEEVMNDKPYTLREIEANDLDYVIAILDKIGIEQVASCFDKEQILKFIGERKIDDQLIKEYGVSAMLKIAMVVVKNYRNAKPELYTLLAAVSGRTVEDIKRIKLPIFIKMISEVFTQQGFIDSFKVASSLFLK